MHKSQSPQTGQVYFNEEVLASSGFSRLEGLNPLKRVKFISILSKGGVVTTSVVVSQSPQTGQVYFNTHKLNHF